MWEYQQSAYGQPWKMVKVSIRLSDLEKYQSDFWVKMLSERHHRIVNMRTCAVHWEHRSEIAPEPGSKETT